MLGVLDAGESVLLVVGGADGLLEVVEPGEGWLLVVPAGLEEDVAPAWLDVPAFPVGVLSAGALAEGSLSSGVGFAGASDSAVVDSASEVNSSLVLPVTPAGSPGALPQAAKTKIIQSITSAVFNFLIMIKITCFHHFCIIYPFFLTAKP